MKVICGRCGRTTMNEESVSGGTDWGCESCGQVSKEGTVPYKPPTSSRSSEAVGYKPCGLTHRDSLDDALKRADELAGPDSHSGQLTDNKDLRRIVLLAYEYRKAKGL